MPFNCTASGRVNENLHVSEDECTPSKKQKNDKIECTSQSDQTTGTAEEVIQEEFCGKVIFKSYGFKSIDLNCSKHDLYILQVLFFSDKATESKCNPNNNEKIVQRKCTSQSDQPTGTAEKVLPEKLPG